MVRGRRRESKAAISKKFWSLMRLQLFDRDARRRCWSASLLSSSVALMGTPDWTSLLHGSSGHTSNAILTLLTLLDDTFSFSGAYSCLDATGACHSALLPADASHGNTRYSSHSGSQLLPALDMAMSREDCFRGERSGAIGLIQEPSRETVRVDHASGAYRPSCTQ